MTPALKSQFLGVSLATLTALGCIAYERLVKQFSFEVVQVLNICIYIVALITSCSITGMDGLKNVGVLLKTPTAWASATAFVTLYAACTYIWYSLTKAQGVMVGATYEIKYIVIMGILYTALGSRPMSFNIVIGVVLALCSVYFISK